MCFLAVLGLRRCAGFFPGVMSGGCSRVALPRLLTAAASLATDHGL